MGQRVALYKTAAVWRREFAEPGGRPGPDGQMSNPGIYKNYAFLPYFFCLGRGFFLCSLEGRSRAAVPSPAVCEPLRFPAKSVFLLHLHPLETEPWRNERGVCATEDRPWWKALYWEKRGEIPLRKSKTTG